MSESEEPSSIGPIPFSSCLIHPFLVRLVQENSFLRKNHENPYNHVRYYQMVRSRQPTGVLIPVV
jgi:hypothetical protein